MKTKWKTLLGFVLGILCPFLVLIVLLAVGALDIGADAKPSYLEQRLAPWGRDRGVTAHAPKEKNPYAGNAEAIATGLADYRENCLVCHGAPDMEDSKISKGLSPPAPGLDMEDSSRPDGEIFWVVKHGLKMTSMPAFGPSHSDEEIWKLVAFIRHLPDLTGQEKDALRASTAKDAHAKGG